MQNILFLLILISCCKISCSPVDKPRVQRSTKDTISSQKIIPKISLTAEDSFQQELAEIEALLEDIDSLYLMGDSLSWELDYNLEEAFEAEVAALDSISLKNWKKSPPKTFKTTQMQFESVQKAYASHQSHVQKLLLQQDIYSFDIDLYLRAFKEESELEIWAKAKNTKNFKLLTTYHFYKGGTRLGPKEREGDMQVPEGCYYIDYFNPHSDYVLSMRINYPNAVDSVRNASEAQMGSAICIHGNYVSAGCLAMTDFRIPVLYILAVEAMKNTETKIPVHIFPYRMNSHNQKNILPLVSENTEFWASLATIYKKFEEEHILPKVKFDKDLYRF